MKHGLPRSLGGWRTANRVPSYIGRWGSRRRPEDGSRMSREVHVRFCERLEAKFLWPTHPYIPMRRGFLYLVAIIDWATRRVLSWRLSNSLTAGFCVEALGEGLVRFGNPGTLHTD